MCGRFNGWPDEAFDVLLKLEGDPPPSFREGLRKEREHLVRRPMIALLQDVADADDTYDNFFVWGFRIMLWPWQRQVGCVRIEHNIELSVTFDLDGLHVQGAGGSSVPFARCTGEPSGMSRPVRPW